MESLELLAHANTVSTSPSIKTYYDTLRIDPFMPDNHVSEETQHARTAKWISGSLQRLRTLCRSLSAWGLRKQRHESQKSCCCGRT